VQIHLTLARNNYAWHEIVSLKRIAGPREGQQVKTELETSL